MLGSTVRKNVQPTAEDLLPLAGETLEDQQMLKRALEEQKNAKSQHIGPGHYDPRQGLTMKKSPSLSFTKHGLTGPALAEGLADMAELVTGRGNMAERVTAARERI